MAMRKFPQFDASVSQPDEEVIYKSYVNVGIAVDTERGLLVPVLSDVDTKSITQIAAGTRTAGGEGAHGQAHDGRDVGWLLHRRQSRRHRRYGVHADNNHPEVAIMGMSQSAMEPLWNGTTSSRG